MKEQGDLLCNHLKKAFTEGCEAVKNVYKSPANKIRKSYLKKYILVSVIGIFPLVIDLCVDYMVATKSIITLIEEYSVKGSFIWTFITVGLCAIMDGSFFWSQQGQTNLDTPNKSIYNIIWTITIFQLIYYIALSRAPAIHINKVNCVANISIVFAIATLVFCFIYQISLANCSYYYGTYLEHAAAQKGVESYAK